MSFGWNTLIAIYGAVLSTALGAIKILEFLRDRSAVRVSLCLRQGGPDDAKGRYLVTKVVNQGRRPVTIDETGAEYASGVFLLATIFWPKNVRPPVPLTESMQFEGFIPVGAALKLEDVRGGFAKGSDGKLYRSRRWVHRSS